MGEHLADPLIEKLERRGSLSNKERLVLRGVTSKIRFIELRDNVVRDGDYPAESILLLKGIAGRYKVLKDGGRQITSIYVAGDFIDLQSFLLKTMDHPVVALAPCTVASVPHDLLLRITDDYPRLTRLLWQSTLIDGAITREWLVTMGRRAALGRVAHLFCELYLRLSVVGLTKERSFALPLSQAVLGDVLGLSTVHVNRVVQELRKLGIIGERGETVVIQDWEALIQAAEFDAAYLQLEPSLARRATGPGGTQGFTKSWGWKSSMP